MKKLIILSLFMLSTAHGSNFEGRWGAGLDLQSFHTLPAVSLKYFPQEHLGLDFMLGFDTTDSNGATLIGVKVQRNVNTEEHMSFYLGTGIFALSERTTAGGSAGGSELQLLMGAEFGIPGLANLTMQFDTGIAYRTLSTTTFRTLGSGFIASGIHYYF